MIADLSTLNPTYLQIGLGIILLWGIISGLANGAIKTLFKIAIYVLYFVLLYFLTPVVSSMLQSFGFIENFVNSTGIQGNEIVAAILPQVIKITYDVIAGIGLFIVGMIIVKIITFIFRALFRKKGAINRILGMALGFVINSAIATVLLTFVSSTLLFTGGDTWINNASGVREFNSVTQNMRQKLLCDNGIICSVEEVLAVSLGTITGGEMTPEKIEQYTQTISKIDEIAADPEGYISGALNEDGTINVENASAILSDLAVISEIANNLELVQSIIPELEPQIEQFVNQIPEGETIELPQDAIDNLNTIVDNLELSPELAAKIDYILANQVVPAS